MHIITGSIAYDYIMDFPGNFADHVLPDQTHQINLSFIVNKFAKRRGGTAGNVSYTLSLLHIPNILLSCAGKDFEEYRLGLLKVGNDCSHVKVYKNTYTSTGFAMTDKINNQIWGYYYGALDHASQLKLPKSSTDEDLVLIGPQGAKGSMSFVNQCVTRNIPYVFDPGFILTQVTNEELTYGIRHAKYIIGNDYEIKLIKSRVSNFAENAIQAVIITTLASDGAIIEENNNTIKIPAVPPVQLIDPSGAGDAWRAGFLAGLSMKLPLHTCGLLGSLSSTYTIEQYGTQEHHFTKTSFTKRFKDEYNENLKL